MGFKKAYKMVPTVAATIIPPIVPSVPPNRIIVTITPMIAHIHPKPGISLNTETC